jgi:putative ABC transport system permease protein
VFGLIPALVLTRDANRQSLHSGRAGSLQLSSRRLHRGLVLSEVALSIVPLVAAGLMLRTFMNLLDAPIGFNPEHVVTARVPLNLDVFSTVDRRSALYRDVMMRVGELPGVDAASVGGPLPLAPVQSTQLVWRSEDREPTLSISMQQSIMPGYFAVMGIPIRAGRDISDDDISHNRRVVVVDERLAKILWNGEAVGKRLGIGEAKRPLEVVGIAGAIRGRDVRDSVAPMTYVPSHVYEIEQTLVVKTRARLSTIGPAIKDAVEALGTGRAVFDIRSMEEVVLRSISRQRFNVLLMTIFAGAALLLAAIGVYGLMAYSVEQRTQEIGIRMALGAGGRDVRRMVVFQGMRLAIIGVVVGLAAALGLSQLIASLLFGVQARDPMVFVAIPLLLTVVSLIAVWLPAHRASTIDPLRALRYE